MSLPRSRTTFHSQSFVGLPNGASVGTMNTEQPTSQDTISSPPSSPIDSAVTSSVNTRARAISTLPPPASHTRSRRPNPIGANKYTLFLVRRILSRPLVWVVVVLLTLVGWWSHAGSEYETSRAGADAVQLRLRQLFPPEVTRDLQFYPASNHKIHVSSPEVEMDEQWC